MEDDGPDAEALRRRLYRPEASAHDLAVYLRATAVADPAEPPLPEATAPHRTPRWPAVAGAAAVVVALLVGAGLVAGTIGRPLATPVRTLAAGPTVSFVAVEVLDGGPQPYASGAATREAVDRYLYTVARGDRPNEIAARFGICTGAVLVALPYGVDAAALPPGMRLQLSRANGDTSGC